MGWIDRSRYCQDLVEGQNGLSLVIDFVLNPCFDEASFQKVAELKGNRACKPVSYGTVQ